MSAIIFHKKPVFVLLFVTLLTGIALFIMAGSSGKERKSMERTLSLSATGKVSAPSDMLTINTGVHSEAETARDALNMNNKAMKALIDTLKGEGLKPSDIQTINFSVQPKYRHFKNGSPPVISGYQVTNSVHIRVEELGRIGEILDKVVSLGVNQISGLNFSIRDYKGLKEKARKKAVANALAKAQLYAEEAGVRLGRILSITEAYTGSRPMPEVRTMARSMAGSVPVEGGDSSLSAQVSIVWELVD